MLGYNDLKRYSSQHDVAWSCRLAHSLDSPTQRGLEHHESFALADLDADYYVVQAYIEQGAAKKSE